MGTDVDHTGVVTPRDAQAQIEHRAGLGQQLGGRTFLVGPGDLRPDGRRASRPVPTGQVDVVVGDPVGPPTGPASQVCARPSMQRASAGRALRRVSRGVGQRSSGSTTARVVALRVLKPARSSGRRSPGSGWRWMVPSTVTSRRHSSTVAKSSTRRLGTPALASRGAGARRPGSLGGGPPGARTGHRGRRRRPRRGRRPTPARGAPRRRRRSRGSSNPQERGGGHEGEAGRRPSASIRPPMRRPSEVRTPARKRVTESNVRMARAAPSRRPGAGTRRSPPTSRRGWARHGTGSSPARR